LTARELGKKGESMVTSSDPGRMRKKSEEKEGKWKIYPHPSDHLSFAASISGRRWGRGGRLKTAGSDSALR